MPTPDISPVHDQTFKPLRHGVALCLSGGGYRAMLFHLGCLWRLNELQLLSTLSRVSSVSGGSITAGVLGMNWARLGISNTSPVAAAGKFDELVVQPIRRMASTTIDESAVFGGIFLPGSISDHIADHYADILFGKKTLQDLPGDDSGPRFVINATSVQSGVLVRFSKPYIRDYRVGMIKNPTLPLAKAVAASSAFPPILSPCEIDLRDLGLQFEPPDGGEDLHMEPYISKMVLSDGGVYDNLGLETAWKEYDTILVSDGGGHFQPEPAPHHDWTRHAYRVLDLIDSQVRSLRTRQIITLFDSGARKGAFWGIRQNIGIYTAPSTLPCPISNTTALAQEATRLKKLDDRTQERLINWGYAVADAALRTRFNPQLASPGAAFPYPQSGV